MKRIILIGTLFSLILFVASFAGAQEGANIGTLCWQKLPFSDILCFNFENRDGFSFSAVGWQHAPGSYKIPIVGALVFDNYANRFKLA